MEFETPSVEVVKFDEADVLASSGDYTERADGVDPGNCTGTAADYPWNVGNENCLG